MLWPTYNTLGVATSAMWHQCVQFAAAWLSWESHGLLLVQASCWPLGIAPSLVEVSRKKWLVRNDS